MLSDDDDGDDEGADDEEEEDSNGPQAWIGLKYNRTAQAGFQSISEAVSGPILIGQWRWRVGINLKTPLSVLNGKMVANLNTTCG